HPRDALGEVAVRARLEERKRREREPAHVVDRGRRDRRELGERRRGRWQRRNAALLEQRQLPRLADTLVRRSLVREPVEAHLDQRVAAIELERCAVRGGELLARVK